MTVALDTRGPDAAKKYVDAANPTHPSLIDESHVCDELFGFVNVPNGVWIDEDGMLVRPAEPAFPWRPPYADLEPPTDLAPEVAEVLAEARKIKTSPEEYVAAVRDWAANGASSRFALAPDEVVRRSQPRPPDVARAGACFELGQHLHRSGHPHDAVRWFREAHRLQPDNWTYKRQAWSLVDKRQGRTEHYEGSWLDDVRAIGAENYYPPFVP